MKAFQYVAMDDTGRMFRSTIVASSLEAAKTTLRNRGLSITQMEEIKSMTTPPFSPSRTIQRNFDFVEYKWAPIFYFFLGAAIGGFTTLLFLGLK